MAITNEQKMAIALRFVTAPKPYFNRGNFVDAHLCDFNTCSISFKFSDKGQCSPGLGIYTRGHRQDWINEFNNCCPEGFGANLGQQHRGDPGNGWISFCKAGCQTQESVYHDIVEQGNLQEWRSLFIALKARLEHLAGESQIQGEIQNEENKNLSDSAEIGETSTAGSQNTDSEEDDMSDMEIWPRNRLVFGAPGTGKSHKLEADCAVFGDNYERVTFYPTYSYAQFVGTYKPVMRGEGADEAIAYEFVPGPFLRVLVKALNEVPDADGKKKDWCLIIEEINRANAAAVFGDVFQLLDRGSNGESEYAVAASEDVKKYLEKNLTDGGKQALKSLAGSTDKLKIPANMYLWATMNSADQGVFPLDTAFKRRWEFEYIGINDGVTNVCKSWMLEGHDYKWNDVRQFINGALSAYGVNEDKLMGPYFITPPAGVVGDFGEVFSLKGFDVPVGRCRANDSRKTVRQWNQNIFRVAGKVGE